MQSLNLLSSMIIKISFLIVSYIIVFCNGLDCVNPNKVAYTISVDKSGKGDFTTVQAAIDSIPENNNQWILIQIAAGVYKEKVEIPVKKPCLYFQGAGRRQTSIEWDDRFLYESETSSSATVTFIAENILVKGITFKNTYNLEVGAAAAAKIEWKRAVATRITGDKAAFYECSFLGLQDTLWDEKGRHFFYNCYIEGSVDFIFGRAQSVYEKCEIYVNIERYAPGLRGFITAQKKEWPDKKSGFVFKTCVIHGVGHAMLGRAWGPYSTVIISRSDLSEVVSPEGWNAWNYVGHESNFTYVEVNNAGPGANTSKRVPWINKIGASQLQRYLNILYINEDGWLQKLP